MTDDEIHEHWYRTQGDAVTFARAIIAAYTTKLRAGVELPEPINCNFRYGRAGYFEPPYGAAYSKDQLQQYAAAAAAQARMKALDEAMLAVNSGVLGHGECAAAIESLKSELKRDYQTFYYTKEQP